MAFDPTDPDTKAALDKIKADHESDIAGLKTKVEGLISVNKELKKGREIDPADLEKLEAENENLKSKLTATEKAAKDTQKAAETAAKALEQERGVTHKLLAENGLIAELTKAGVTDPDYLEMAKAAHIGKVTVVAEGDTRKAMYGDKPLADAIKEWAGTDAAKKVIAAPINSGGGLGGSNGGKGGDKTVTRQQFDGMGHAERASFVKDGGKVVDAAA